MGRSPGRPVFVGKLRSSLPPLISTYFLPPAATSPSPPLYNISSLSTDLLFNIFNFLDEQTRVNILPQVCQRWHELLTKPIRETKPTLYHDVHFVNDNPTPQEAINVLNQTSSLRSLMLSDREDVHELLSHAIVNNYRTIESVSVFNGPRKKSRCLVGSVLCRLITECRGLQELRFCNVHTKTERFFPSIGKYLLALKSIQLPKGLEDCGPSLSSISLNSSNNVEHVRMHRLSYVHEEVVRTLCYRKKASLKTLDLNAYGFTDMTMKSISGCSQLKTLSLNHLMYVHNEGLNHLCDLQNLNSLTLTECSLITEVGWNNLLNSENMQGLQHLCIIKCLSFNDLSVDFNLVNLESLRLQQCCNLSVTGFRRLFGENKLQKLVKLEIVKCSKLNDAIMRVVQMNLPSLRSVKVEGCRRVEAVGKKIIKQINEKKK